MQRQSACTIIAGDVGIGKTALVKKALADLSILNATCVYGKFEQYKDNEPYIPINQIIDNITNHMLTLPQNKLLRIRKTLTERLGKDCALLAEIVPPIIKITGSLNKVKIVDYHKLKNRMERALLTFINIAATELYPLIIAVDDLQWSDKPTWDIIKALNDPLNHHDLYIILTYRNNLEEYRVKVQSLLHELSG